MNRAHNETNLEVRLRAEVEALHAFIAAWFRGEVQADQSTFDTGLASRLADEMINIQPSGRTLTRERLLASIFDGHGSNAAFAITIRDFRLLKVSADLDLAVASYLEDQQGAKNSDPPDNVRISSVVFDLTDIARGPRWLHIHETAMD